MYTKNRSYANRGQGFESFIRFANDRYQHKKIAVIAKQATEFIPIRNGAGKVVNVKVEHKSTVDFLGRYKCYPIAIEAKNSNEESIRFDRVEPHQADYMDAYTEQPGTIGLVLLSFNLKHFYAIPWQFWKAAYDLRVRQNDRTTPKTARFFNQEWNIPKKVSVRMDELCPEWKIPSHDYDYGLHYLVNADKYITPEKEKEKTP